MSILTPSQVKQLYNEGKPAIIKPIHWWKLNEDYSSASLLNYANGNDSNLNYPNDDYITVGFIPVTDIAYLTIFFIGNYSWEADGQTPGPNKSFGYPGTIGNTYGQVTLYGNSTSPCTYFAGSEYNGLQRIYLPRYANNDNNGGYIEFYYNRDAWYNALYNVDSAVVITLDGSVYKDSVSYVNLIVSGSGIVGPAGGAKAVDSGAVPQDGTIVSTLPSQDGYKGKCCDFNGSTSYITTQAQKTTVPISFCFWMYNRDASVVQDPLNNDNGNFDFGLRLQTDQSIDVFRGTSYTTYGIDWPSIMLHKWTHVGVTIKNGQNRLYINGVKVDEDATGSDTPDATTFTIGARSSDKALKVNGLMEDVRIYDVYLTEIQMIDIYKATEKHYS